MGKEKTLDDLAGFHGHLGPYVVVGYRMGEAANEELTPDPFEKEVIVRTGPEPPLSCMVDGIQFSSGCTLGKGNIRIEDDKKPKAIFSREEKSVEINVKRKIHEKIKKARGENLEKISKKIFEKPTSELFEVKTMSSCHNSRPERS